MKTNYFQLGETITTVDPAVALRGQYGTFQVTTPGGDELLITCKPNHSISNVEWADTYGRRFFTVRKISEPTMGNEEVKTLTPG